MLPARSHLRRPPSSYQADLAWRSHRTRDPSCAPAREDAGLSHVDLLALARSVQAAAVADDPVELARTIARLRVDLRHHVEGERAVQDRLAPALRAVVFTGQERLLRIVDTIGAAGADDRGSACLVHVAELVVALQRQGALEAAALARLGVDA